MSFPELSDILADPAGTAPLLPVDEALKLARQLSNAIPALLQRGIDGHDRLIDASRVAVVLQKSKLWVTRNSERLPFAMKIGEEWRYSDDGLQRYIRDHARLISKRSR